MQAILAQGETQTVRDASIRLSPFKQKEDPLQSALIHSNLKIMSTAIVEDKRSEENDGLLTIMVPTIMQSHVADTNVIDRVRERRPPAPRTHSSQSRKRLPAHSPENALRISPCRFLSRLEVGIFPPKSASEVLISWALGMPSSHSTHPPNESRINSWSLLGLVENSPLQNKDPLGIEPPSPPILTSWMMRCACCCKPIKGCKRKHQVWFHERGHAGMFKITACGNAFSQSCAFETVRAVCGEGN